MGTSIRVTDWCWAYADGMVSVIDGAGNHSKRVAIEGQFGLRFYFDSDGPDHDVLAPLPGSW
jgi:DNA-binding beta-propeller fold protein YncE